jgi:hypothetical protein
VADKREPKQSMLQDGFSKEAYTMRE